MHRGKCRTHVSRTYGTVELNKRLAVNGLPGVKENTPLNNSNNRNNNNNRRRGRGGNRQQGGGQQLNRIDSRARGNAPQLLEKYRKLAHDAHLNGDRVQEEYYLQFADHYFRVLADQRVRQEEQRTQRQDRWQEGGEQPSDRYDGDDSGDYNGESDYSNYDSAPYSRNERAEPAAEEPQPEERSAEPSDDAGASYDPGNNPFVRDSRDTRGLRPRRDDRERRPRQQRDERPRDYQAAEQAPAFDPSSLPPSISSVRDDADAAPEPAAEAPRKRTRKPKPAADDSLEVIS